MKRYIMKMDGKYWKGRKITKAFILNPGGTLSSVWGDLQDATILNSDVASIRQSLTRAMNSASANFDRNLYMTTIRKPQLSLFDKVELIRVILSEGSVDISRDIGGEMAARIKVRDDGRM